VLLAVVSNATATAVARVTTQSELLKIASLCSNAGEKSFPASSCRGGFLKYDDNSPLILTRFMLINSSGFRLVSTNEEWMLVYKVSKCIKII
jgi:hypothetical protein